MLGLTPGAPFPGPGRITEPQDPIPMGRTPAEAPPWLSSSLRRFSPRFPDPIRARSQGRAVAATARSVSAAACEGRECRETAWIWGSDWFVPLTRGQRERGVLPSPAFHSQCVSLPKPRSSPTEGPGELGEGLSPEQTFPGWFWKRRSAADPSGIREGTQQVQRPLAGSGPSSSWGSAHFSPRFTNKGAQTVSGSFSQPWTRC